jgi:peptidoglycan/LPS O-acetylase OafA/YrhL
MPSSRWRAGRVLHRGLCMKHRTEIDGLRTFAVMPVLLSHAGFTWCSGGYVGVDVFFVISGFLITRIVLDELAAGTFSTLRFYERRARRILPAVFVVMIACLAAGWPLMSADAYQNLGQSVVATTLFANNVLLALTSGYWDMESSFKPLLHTWSLGAEEQYYAVVPLVLMLVHRFARSHAGLAIAAIGVVSFALCLWSIERAPVANFYMLHTRAWELAVGGLASAWLRDRADREPSSDLLAALGLAMILAASAAFPAALPSPSPWTLLPVIGTALILIYCREGLTHRLLTWRPIVFLGLISYSTYLWHQPLFAFLRVYSLRQPESWQFGLLIVPTLLLAWLSWRFVEAPFRDRRRVSRRKLVAALAPVAAALVAFGALLHVAGGLPWRLPVAPGSPPTGSYKRYNMAVFTYFKDRFSPGKSRKLLVVGNSTARDLVNMVHEAKQFPGYEIVYRDDISPCDADGFSAVQSGLVRSATLIAVAGPKRECDWRKLVTREEFRDKIVFVGPRDFGDNLNPFARLPLDRRAGARATMSDATISASERWRARIPVEIYVDVVRRLSADGRTVPIFDDSGRMLSEDRKHVTRPGALYVGKRVFADPAWDHVRQTGEARTASAPGP